MTKNKKEKQVLPNYFVQDCNPGQNIWQKWHFIPLSPISMSFAPIHGFLREDFPENSNIDMGGGTSVPKNLI